VPEVTKGEDPETAKTTLPGDRFLALVQPCVGSPVVEKSTKEK